MRAIEVPDVGGEARKNAAIFERGRYNNGKRQSQARVDGDSVEHKVRQQKDTYRFDCKGARGGAHGGCCLVVWSALRCEEGT